MGSSSNAPPLGDTADASYDDFFRGDRAARLDALRSPFATFEREVDLVYARGYDLAAADSGRPGPLRPARRGAETLALIAGIGTGLAIIAALQVGKPPVARAAATPGPGARASVSVALAMAEPSRAPARPALRIEADLATLHRSAPVPRVRPSTGPAPDVVTAKAIPPAPGPAIALIVDDMGLDRRRSAQVVALDGPLTLSYLPYARHLAVQTRAARAAGHELMLHLPMEPKARRADPGPGVLAPWLPRAEIARRLRTALGSFEGFVGVNNHMGSLFTADRKAMRLVLGQLRRRNLLFVDSRTGPRSVARDVATGLGLRFGERDVFLDHEDDDRTVAFRLAELEAAARRNGVAIGIGHPRRATIAALRRWIPQVRRRGFRLVPITKAVPPRSSLPANRRFTALEARPG